MKKRNKLFAVVLVLALSLSITIPAFATGGFENEGFEIERTCDGAKFSGTLAEGDVGELQAELWTADPWLGGSYVWDTTVPISGPGDFDVFVPWGVNPDGLYYRVAIAVNGTLVATWEEFLDCPTGEGCTPGYWKNHFEDWPPTGYDPGDLFADVFGVDLGYATLGDAIKAKGGGNGKVSRHGTAALLSAAHPAVDYPFTEADVITFVQAGDVEILVYANELGCEIP